MSVAPASQETLAPAVWRGRRAAHAARADRLVGARRERSRRGESDPVEDFLFTYYPFRLAALRRWTPGAGVALAEADELVDGRRFLRGADGFVRAALPDPAQAARLAFSLKLCRAVATRAPFLGCFGLHEWAMVYGLDPREVRHTALPLRIPPEAITRAVDEIGLRCTHIDAYRFFTVDATPRNALVPTRASQPDLEQPGCLHASMDLYKYAMWFQPFVGSDLVADCFEVARAARELDMRASPYDVAEYGLTPIQVETPRGRRAYAEAQRALMSRTAPLRERLLEALTRLDRAAPANVLTHSRAAR